uniref:CARDB protein n=1 Tax=Candidatus Kentrum sp. TC TaxID=2126339 RepID=A0A450YAC1_9GAMM|nr:MAG: CARDB protein [Candidatus Kentron sp. TC]
MHTHPRKFQGVIIMYISLNGFWGKPDLIVSSLGTNKITYRAGESLRITATTRNIGSSRVGYSYTKFYLSRDRYLNSSDTYLGSDYVSSLGAV